jgi:hypothetical protein
VKAALATSRRRVASSKARGHKQTQVRLLWYDRPIGRSTIYLSCV